MPTPASSSVSSAATPATSATPAGVPGGTPELDAGNLRTFFAGLVPYMLKRNDIAGGVVAVVKDGHLLFARGYGYADVAKRTPVVADKTLFRIGSISKLFTWTAVMQLVGEGKIDLNRNINDYLDFKVPSWHGKPITMRDLMTHTPGFAEVIRDLMVARPGQLVPLRTYLRKRMPPGIFPPGKVVAYSNYGATLAGYIVQRVSGEPFNRYVDEHILAPLGMSRSTFAQPLPDRLRPDMAKGYVTATDNKSMPFELIQPWPAGSFTSTATDMAHFMIAQLQDGRYQGTSILPAATARQMHTRHYVAAKGLNGFDLGFYQENRNGLRIIGHGGDTNVFHSDLHLLLDKDVGVFMSFNSKGKAPNGIAENVRTSLFRAFLDHFYPYTPPAKPTVATARRDASRVAGWYWASRRENSAFRLVYLLGQTRIKALPNGEIAVGMLKDPSGSVKRWREIGPLYYQQVGGQSHLSFATRADGSIKWWGTDDFPPVELFQPVHGLQQLGTLRTLTRIALAVLVLTLAIWIGGAITRKRFGSTLALSGGQARLRLAARIGVIAQLAVFAGWIALLAWFSQPQSLAHSDIGGRLVMLYMLGVLGILGGIAIVLDAAWRIARGPGGLLVRASEVVLGLSALFGIWAIVACGLVNFNVHF